MKSARLMQIYGATRAASPWCAPRYPDAARFDDDRHSFPRHARVAARRTARPHGRRAVVAAPAAAPRARCDSRRRDAGRHATARHARAGRHARRVAQHDGGRVRAARRRGLPAVGSARHAGGRPVAAGRAAPARGAARRRTAARPDPPEPDRQRRVRIFPAGRARVVALSGGRMAACDRPRAAPYRSRAARVRRSARRAHAAADPCASTAPDTQRAGSARAIRCAAARPNSSRTAT